jgi:hypothetical protein
MHLGVHKVYQDTDEVTWPNKHQDDNNDHLHHMTMPDLHMS